MASHIYTQFVETKLNDFITDEDLESKIEEGDTKELENLLSEMHFEPLTFEKYLFQYLFNKFLSDSASNYEEISADVYYEIIQKEFAKNGLKGKGSLDFSVTTPLNKIKLLFPKPATQIDRLVVYLFAFGLDMDVEELQTFICKALWQPAINLRDYKEVIYYWCLKNVFGTARIAKIQDLLSFYSDCDKESSFSVNSFSTKNTQELLSDFDNIHTEDALRNYLKKLKFSKTKQSSKSLQEEFHYNLSLMSRTDEGIPENLENGEQTDRADALYDSSLSCQKIVCELEKQRISAYKDCTEALLDVRTSSSLFKDIYWTQKSLQHRFDGSVMVSRNEFLLSLFLIYAPELSEIVFRPNSPEELKYFRYDDFRESANLALELCNMMPVYPRNPFELFLFICLFHDKPYEYFLANWHQAILFNQSNN